MRDERSRAAELEHRGRRRQAVVGCRRRVQNRRMELTWYGRTCIRLRGRDAVVVADPYQTVVGPTGRGITGEIVTYSPPRRPAAAEGEGHALARRLDAPAVVAREAFVLDGPGEYEVRDVLLTGVRTYRDDAKGAERGKQVAFVVELDGMHTIHLGEIGHLLTEEKLGDIGPVDIACVPVGGSLSPHEGRGAVAQLDPKIVVAMPLDDETRRDRARRWRSSSTRWAASRPPQPKLSVTISRPAAETTTVLLESRGKV